MSTTFYGRLTDGSSVALDIEDPRWLNFSSANARAFLAFLRVEAGEGPDGEVALPMALRAVMRARATFERRVGRFTRQMSDTKRPGRCRVIEGGLDEAYFERRLDSFERFVDAMVKMGAISIYWA